MRGSRANDRRRPSPSSNRTRRFPASGFSGTLIPGHSSALGGLFPGSNVALRHSHLSVLRCLRIEAEWRSSESIPFCQGPFAPRALPRFVTTTGLSDSPALDSRLMDSAYVLPRFSRGRWQGFADASHRPAGCRQQAISASALYMLDIQLA
jgi:hypothetical protein